MNTASRLIPSLRHMSSHHPPPAPVNLGLTILSCVVCDPPSFTVPCPPVLTGNYRQDTLRNPARQGAEVYLTESHGVVLGVETARLPRPFAVTQLERDELFKIEFAISVGAVFWLKGLID